MNTPFAHDAFVYDDDSTYVDALAPFVVEGLARDEAVCVVTRTDKAALLRDALGRQADTVDFIDATDWYRKPVRTIAGYNQLILDGLARGVRRLRVIGEVEFGETSVQHAEWTRYESMLNVAFHDHPAWVVCPYDVRVLPDDVIADALRTHPHAYMRPDERRACDHFADIGEFACPVPTIEDELVVLSVGGTEELSSVRRVVRDAAESAGFAPARLDDLVVVANELTANACVHGRPPVIVRLGRSGGSVVVQVEDAGGNWRDASAGFVPPDSNVVGGRGTWLARHFADRLEIATERGRTIAAAEFTL